MFSILTCIVLPVLGNQSHHKDIQGCCTGYHTSHRWSIASTAEQLSSFATDHQNSVSSLLHPNHKHGCCTGNRRCGCLPTRHTEESHSSPPLPEVAWCPARNLRRRNSPGCDTAGHWSCLGSCTGRKAHLGWSGTSHRCSRGWRCRGCRWGSGTRVQWRRVDTSSVGPNGLTHMYLHSCNSDSHRNESHTHRKSQWSPEGTEMHRGYDYSTILDEKRIIKALIRVDLIVSLTGGHLQMKPWGVLLATAHVPPFLQGLPLHPSNTLSQRWPGE